MTCNVIFAGFGGQGVLTAGLALAEIAVSESLEVLWSPAYGGEMRGGKAYSMVMLADAPILSPVCDTLDALVAMNGPALGFCDRLKKDGLLVVNTDGTEEPAPAGFCEKRLPLVTLAAGAGSRRSANIAAVGSVIGALGLFSLEAAEAGIRRFFEKKGHPEAAQSGAAALRAGYLAMRNDQ